MVNRNAMATSVNAAPQPRSWAGKLRRNAFWKIWYDSAVFGPLNTFQLNVLARADGEQQRRRLTGGAGDGEQAAADHTGRSGRQHHAR